MKTHELSPPSTWLLPGPKLEPDIVEASRAVMSLQGSVEPVSDGGLTTTPCGDALSASGEFDEMPDTEPPHAAINAADAGMRSRRAAR